MNPFNKIPSRKKVTQLYQPQNQNNPIIFDNGSQWGDFHPIGKPSWAERVVGKGTGVLKGISIGILALAGLATLFALFIPFMKFLGSLSEWLCDGVDRLYW